MIKIVYFDEKSAVDYIDIYNGGRKSEDRSNQKGTSSRLSGDAGVSIKDGMLFKMLSPLLTASAQAKAEGQLKRVTEDLVRTTISNTVLSDYIELADEDENIFKFEGYRVYPEKDSISHIKMYTPYLKLLNLDNVNLEIDIAGTDNVLENAKGYYELIAEKENNKSVLRFNLKGFKNNYFLSDLIKMNLKYYAIKTGQMNLEDLNAKNEFSFENNDVTSLAELEQSEEKKQNQTEVEVYDVVLAGVAIDG